jgi:hypothetical protein
MAKQICDLEEIAALAMQGAVIIMDAAKADKDMTAESLKKLKKCIQEKLFVSQALPTRRKSKSPADRKTKDKFPSLPRRASVMPPRGLSRSPPPSRSASSSPAPRKTGRSPSPKGTKDTSVPEPRYHRSPISYKIERFTKFTKRPVCKINTSWATARNPCTKRMLLFNTLFSCEKVRKIEKPYLMVCCNWDETTHPFYREPCEDDKLSIWTRDTDGIEILHRALLPRHPTGFTNLHMYSCTTKVWLVPVIKNNTKANALADYLAMKLQPF